MVSPLGSADAAARANRKRHLIKKTVVQYVRKFSLLARYMTEASLCGTADEPGSATSPTGWAYPPRSVSRAGAVGQWLCARAAGRADPQRGGGNEPCPARSGDGTAGAAGILARGDD